MELGTRTARAILVVGRTPLNGCRYLPIRHPNAPRDLPAQDFVALAAHDLRPGGRKVLGVISRERLKVVEARELPAVLEGQRNEKRALRCQG